MKRLCHRIFEVYVEIFANLVLRNLSKYLDEKCVSYLSYALVNIYAQLFLARNIPTARDRNINNQLGYSDILFCSLRDGSCDVIALPSVQGRVFSSSPGGVQVILAVNGVSC